MTVVQSIYPYTIQVAFTIFMALLQNDASYIVLSYCMVTLPNGAHYIEKELSSDPWPVLLRLHEVVSASNNIHYSQHTLLQAGQQLVHMVLKLRNRLQGVGVGRNICNTEKLLHMHEFCCFIMAGTSFCGPPKFQRYCLTFGHS